MIWLGGLLLTILGFIFGKIFSQSETILSDKRRVYEEFLRNCPQPDDVVGENAKEIVESRVVKLKELKGPLMIYAAPLVMIALSEYLNVISTLITQFEEGGAHNADLQRLATRAQNSLIIEMRRDSLAWSVFAFRGEKKALSEGKF